MSKNSQQNIPNAYDYDDDYKQAIEAERKFTEQEKKIRTTAPKIGDFVMAKIFPQAAQPENPTNPQKKQPPNPIHKERANEVFGKYLHDNDNPDNTITVLTNTKPTICTNPRLTNISDPITQRQVQAIQRAYNKLFNIASQTPEPDPDPDDEY